MRIRVHQFARAMGVDTQVLLEIAKAKGFDLKSHSSNLEESQIRVLRDTINAMPELPKPAPKKKKRAVKKKPSPPKPKIVKASKATARRAAALAKAKAEAAVQPPPAEVPAGVAEESEHPAGAGTIASETPPAPAEIPVAAPATDDLGTVEPAPSEAAPEVSPPQEAGAAAGRVASPAAARVVPALISPASPPSPPSRVPTRQPPRGPTSPVLPSRRGHRSRMRPMRMPVSRRSSGGRRATATAPPPVSTKPIEVSPPISVKQLSAALGVKANVILVTLLRSGAARPGLNINALLAEPALEVLAKALGREITVKHSLTEAEKIEALRVSVEETPEDLVPRAPVVVFLGHVDHGKTSLLDAIRSSEVAKGEAGGITQHIGAYRVQTKSGQPVVFLDTPGHEAFTEMRARGAHATDVAVLVVAADDGVMPQTEEACNHAKAAGVPILVAINKVDKPDANVLRTKQQLANLGLQPEDWGGKTVMIECSAVTGQGIDHLVEMLALEADLLELKANPHRSAEGVVIEARKEEGRGIVATLLVGNGTLHRGDVVLAGRGYGRVRSIQDDKGKRLEQAGPATPVEVSGLQEVPDAGSRFVVVQKLSQAKEMASDRRQRARMSELSSRQTVTLESLFSRIQEGKSAEVCIVVKSDVKGSAEVLHKSLLDLSTGDVRVRLIHEGLGAVSESDVLLAEASEGIVIGFQVGVEDKARVEAQHGGVDVRCYQVIYELLEDVRKAMEGRLEPEKREEIQGHVEVRRTFKISRIGTIAGCFVKDGLIRRNSQVRLQRNGIVVWTGRIDSLKRIKDDAREVKSGFECGIKLEGYDDVKIGDVLEAFTFVLEKRTLAGAHKSAT